MLICRLCRYETENSLQVHLRIAHGMSNQKYQGKFPDAKIYSQAYGDKLRYTNAHRNPDYKNKLSENTKRLYQDPEWVKRHDIASKGAQQTTQALENHKKGALRYYKNQTLKQKKDQKKACKRSWTDPVTRKNREEGLQKAHRSEEGRKHHSKAMKNFLANPINRENRSISLQKAWAKPENKVKLDKIIKTGLEAAASPKGMENHRLANQNPDLRKKRSLIAKKNIIRLLKNRIKYSNLNKFLKIALNQTGLYPIDEYPIGPYCVDFCFPEKRVVIEADGDFWHANPEFMKGRNLYPIQEKMVRLDKAKNTYLKNHDWTLLRFWETDIKKNTEQCLCKIKETLCQ